MTKGLRRWLRLFHYWTGVIVGLQLLIWLGTAIYFNLTPHSELKGTGYLTQQQTAFGLDSEDAKLESLISLSVAVHSYTDIEQVSLMRLAGKPIYLLDTQLTRYRHQCQQQIVLDAVTAKALQIDKLLATKVAEQTYTGPGNVLNVETLSSPHDEWPKECNPLWQVNIDDDLNTRIYINAINGQLVGHKNDHTDLADLMFKLHFMDYLHQGSFNNPFSWVFGLMMLLLSLSGVYWVIDNLVMKRYRFKLK